MSSETNVWFITGTSSGFGRSITEFALQKGDKVVATLRKPEVLSELTAKYPETLFLVRLDVTQPSEVTAAFAASRNKFGRIDVVVNNAGFCNLGEVESTSDSAARSIFEVNFWGASHVTKESVRFFREENRPIGGRLIQMSSSVGICSIPGTVYYNASKFALEGLSEGLVGELDPSWNIKITLVEPGPFRTNNWVGMAAAMDPPHPAYSNPSLPTKRAREAFASPSAIFRVLNGDPKKVAEAVYNVASMEDAPLRLPIHPAAISSVREKGKRLIEAADKWESWSEDVLIKE